MTILIDIWSLASENGGPTRSAKGLACALASAGVEVVLCSHVPGKVSATEQADLQAKGVSFREGRGIKYRVALADSRQILDEVKPDLVHIQGMWKMSTHAMNVAAAERKIPIVISPHGMLDPWALSVKKWKKRLGMFLYQKGDLKRAAAFHACAEMEAEHIRAFGLKQPILTVPNGVSLPERGGGEEGIGRRYREEAAERKVAEWLEGVDDISFEAALVRLVDEKTSAGEYRFKKPEERESALDGARKFYREFSRKIVPLSDGRYVYFAPDERAKIRNATNAISWAEYAFHAVSNGGAKVSGKNYNERWYNPYKQPAFALIERVLKDEKCFIRLSSADARYHAIVFAGTEATSARLQVVTRLDDAGNIDANLSEVTFTASHKEKKLPRLVPLTEAIRTVVHYQTAAGSNPPNASSIANCYDVDKGGEGLCRRFRGERTALFLSRLHPGKGLMLLAEAWAQVRPQGWKMRVVGPNERGHREEVEARVKELGIAGDWTFVGEVRDEEKWEYYRRADLFIHPSESENFGISIAEALGSGAPVITTTGCPWHDLRTFKCGWWIERSVENLARTLREAVTLSDAARAEMGANARRLIEEKYSWPAIGTRMKEDYEALLHR